MDKILWLLVWFVLFGGTTSRVQPAGQQPDPVGTSPAPRLAALDQPFGLAFGESASLADAGLTLTFERIVEDSRCPADVMCVWSGMVVIGLRVAPAGEPEQSVELGGVTDSDGTLLAQQPQLQVSGSTDVAGYTVELLSVTPYPAQANVPPANATYQAQLVMKTK